MRSIENALKLVAAMQSNSGVAPDVAVGRDVFENPDQDERETAIPLIKFVYSTMH